MPRIARIIVDTNNKLYLKDINIHSIEVESMGYNKALKYYLKKGFKQLKKDIEHDTNTHSPTSKRPTSSNL